MLGAGDKSVLRRHNMNTVVRRLSTFAITALLIVSTVSGGEGVLDVIQIIPAEDFEASGNIGGPFSPASRQYELTNQGDVPIFWGVERTVEWLEFDTEWGQLDPSESVTVTVSLTSEANVLGGGIHTDTLTFTDITNQEVATRGVVLTITALPGVLLVTPSGDFEPAGEPGGPFTPPSKDYQLTNIGGKSLFWGISYDETWLDIDHTFGELDPNESTTVRASLTSLAEALGEGVYNDTITFTNLTSLDEESRAVTFTVQEILGIWVSPESFDVTLTEGTQLTEILSVGNDGTEDLNFSIRTHTVGGLGQSAQENAAQPAPASYDFSVIDDVPYEADELIVRFAATVQGRHPDKAQKNQILSMLGGATIEYSYSIVPGLVLLKLPAPMTVEEAMVIFNESEEILYAQPNYEVQAESTIPNDTRFGDLWGMHNTGQNGGTVDADIDAPEAWDIFTGSSEIIVAVIDTGIDYTHSDLAPNMWVNEAEFNGAGGVDDDGNGYVDDIYGYDFCNDDGDPFDDHYHGTHCAGTIGGVGNNNMGVAGVCWNVKIMAVKFLNSAGSGWTSNAIKSVEYATQMGAHLSSNSWGGGSFSQGLKDAIDAAGAVNMLFVASAGNDSSDNDSSPHYPSSYTSPNIVAVLATDRYDNMANLSNYGLSSVDIGAPGMDILSCEPGNQYQYLDGTSMAAPHVAGACALLWSMDPTLSRQEVADILLRTVDPTLGGLCVSGGRLNLHEAILETRAPWITIVPEAGFIGVGDVNEISVTFDATTLEPGVYQAEIVVSSDDPLNPTIVIPVTMTVNRDDLTVSPLEDFESSGTKGGPFEPDCKTYTLTNIGTEPLSWEIQTSANWLHVSSTTGLLDPNTTVLVDVCIDDPNAALLAPGEYTDTVVFINTDSGSNKHRQAKLTVNPPDMFTESFDTSNNDLAFSTITFLPDGSSAYYGACRRALTSNEFPTDPNGGTNVLLWDDDFAEVIFADGKEVLFHGQRYDRLYIGSNGYVTFGGGDTAFLETLDNHFALPRISALFADLAPDTSENVSYRQLADRIVVTYKDVPLYGDKNAMNSFQIAIFFADGVVRITWLDVATSDGIAGLSEGSGLPSSFVESDLTDYIECCQCGDFNADLGVNIYDLSWLSGYWMESGCTIPHWCDRMDIDRSGSVDAGDLQLAAANWLNIPDVEYVWSEPVLLPELNVPGGDVGLGSRLSSDGLTMYFARVIPAYGHICIVEAYRSTPAGPFTSERILSELHVTGDHVSTPWISEDELRLYYFETVLGVYTIKMAQRSTMTESWTPVKTFGELHMGGVNGTVPTLSENELIIVWQSAYRDGGAGGVDLWMATRNSAEESFGNIRALYELNTSVNDAGPYLLPDGLTLYFCSIDRDGDSGSNIYRATRSSTSETFGNIQLVQLPDTQSVKEEFVFVTPDEETLLYSVVGQGTWVSRWGQLSVLPDPVGHWKFDEGEGTIAYDSAGDNNGTLNGPPAWTSGQIAGSLDFDGTDDYVEITGYKGILGSNSRTCTAWIKTSATVGADIVFWGDPRTNLNRWSFYTRNDGKLAVGIALGYVIGTTDVCDGQWHHVVAVFANDGTPDIAETRLYVDGAEETIGLSMSAVPDTVAYSDVLIGSGGTTYFDGLIDDVRIYDSALSAEEVRRLYQDRDREEICLPW